MDKIQALNTMWEIKSIAEQTNSLLQDECPPNRNRYDMCSQNKHILSKFAEAYEVLRRGRD